MLTTAIKTIPTLLLTAHGKSKKLIEQINQACTDKGVPPAFDVGQIKDAQSLDEIHFRSSPNFRFEGFGIDVGIPPKLTFWVWYKKGSPDGKEIGKFNVKMSRLSQLALNLVPLERVAGLIDQVDDVVDVVEDVTAAINSQNE